MDREDVLSAIFRAKTQIKDLQDQLENLFSLLPESQKPGAYPAGPYILRVRDNYRFDPATALKALTGKQLEAVLVSKPDATRARQVLSGDDYAKCQKKIGVVREVEEVKDEI